MIHSKTITEWQDEFKRLVLEFEKDYDVVVEEIRLGHNVSKDKKLWCKLELKDDSLKDYYKKELGHVIY